MSRIKVDKDSVILALNLTPTGGKGWYDGNCVFCGKPDHMGVIFEGKASFKCFKCGEKGSIIRLLKHIRRTDLMSGQDVIKPVSEQSLEPKSILNLDTVPKECLLPRSYQRIIQHDYLDSRGFTQHQYDVFGVAVAIEDVRYREDYVLFTVYDDNKPVGVLGRSLWSNEEMTEHNNRVKVEGVGRKHVKYKNLSADFSKMLFGIDEIIEGVTNTAIVVEGVMDKASIDRALNLYEDDYKKCLVSFGKNMSSEQIVKMVKKGIKHLILFYDPDAIESIIVNLARAFTYFDSVRCAVIRGDKDAGDMTPIEISTCMGELVDVIKVNSVLINRDKIKKWKR